MDPIDIKEFNESTLDERKDRVLEFVEQCYPDADYQRTWDLVLAALSVLEASPDLSLGQDELIEKTDRVIYMQNIGEGGIYSPEIIVDDLGTFSSEEENPEEALSRQEFEEDMAQQNAEYEAKAPKILPPILLEVYKSFTDSNAVSPLTKDFSEESRRVLFRQALLRLKWQD
jgi:hypothetical protein